jgi:hypothetical protein
MALEDVVTDLLLRWEQQPALTPEELCRDYADHPERAELLEAVRQGMRQLQAVAGLLAEVPQVDASTQSTLPESTPASPAPEQSGQPSSGAELVQVWLQGPAAPSSASRYRPPATTAADYRAAHRRCPRRAYPWKVLDHLVRQPVQPLVGSADQLLPGRSVAGSQAIEQPLELGAGIGSHQVTPVRIESSSCPGAGASEHDVTQPKPVFASPARRFYAISYADESPCHSHSSRRSLCGIGSW